MSELSRYQHIERAKLLLHQRRYKDAEMQAAAVLQQNPNDAEALQLVGHCKLDTKQYEEALKIFQQCLGLVPDDDYVHYLLAFCYYRKHELDISLKYLEQSIALFPYNAGYFSLLSNIYYSQRKYADALHAANQGLNVNAEDVACLNARSAALFRLNKKEEAYETINEALQVNPENDYTHSNYGWHYLEKGKYKQALEHFREALRINPNNVSAKEGYKAALKSKLPFYRWILQYSLWMNHQSRSMRITLILGLWIMMWFISAFQKSGSQIVYYIATFIVVAYIVFVMLSWLGNSIANLFLLASRHGKLVLSESEKISAGLVGLSLLAGIALIACGTFIKSHLFITGLLVCSFAIPLSFLEFPLKIFKGHGRQITIHVMLLCGLLTIFSLFIDQQTALFFGIIYFIFFVGFMWSGSLKSI